MKFSKVLAVSAIAVSLATAAQSFAATLAIGGNYRFGGNLYNNLDLSDGTPSGGAAGSPARGGTTSFLEHRLLLRPDILVDDRFTIKSEWVLLQMGLPPLNDAPEAFGSSLDSQLSPYTNKQLAYLRRLYMEWASDWGIFRVGRMPKSWGLGLLYDPGDDPLDDFGTTVDRVGYQALLGNLGINVAYEKGAEGLINNDTDDIDNYELSLDYSNPESLLEVGLLYSRTVRAAGAAAGVSSSNNFSLFGRKRWEKFQIGGEFGTINYDKIGSVTGALAQIDWTPGVWDFGADFAIASALSNASFAIHPNYRPLMILYRQSLGPQKDPAEVRGGFSGNGVGSAVGAGTGAGSVLTKLSAAYGFSEKKYVLGADAGWATLLRQGTNAGKPLGFEVDLHLTQKWYENFSTTYAAGVLVPGKAFGPSPKTAWGLQLRGALTF